MTAKVPAAWKPSLMWPSHEWAESRAGWRVDPKRRGKCRREIDHALQPRTLSGAGITWLAATDAGLVVMMHVRKRTGKWDQVGFEMLKGSPTRRMVIARRVPVRKIPKTLYKCRPKPPPMRGMKGF